MNPTLELLAGHRTHRSFLDEPLPDEHVHAAVAAAQQAATSSWVQAYSLLRVRRPEERERLADVARGLAGARDGDEHGGGEGRGLRRDARQCEELLHDLRRCRRRSAGCRGDTRTHRRHSWW